MNTPSTSTNKKAIEGVVKQLEAKLQNDNDINPGEVYYQIALGYANAGDERFLLYISKIQGDIRLPELFNIYEEANKRKMESTNDSDSTIGRIFTGISIILFVGFLCKNSN